MGKNNDLKNPDLYINRELSWLKFEERVLGEAVDKSNRLLERVKFLSITASNLDEFFMVRVASLKDMQNAGYSKKDIAGLTATSQLEMVYAATHKLVDSQYEVFNKQLIPQLFKEGIILVDNIASLTREDIAWIDSYFEEAVYPVLTPMAVDSSRPFPLIRNKSLNIAALLRKKGSEETEFATVQVPAGLKRLVRIPTTEGEKYITLEKIIENNMDKLFQSYDILSVSPYRITRNADLAIDEDDAEDLLKEIEKQIKRRQWGEAIRLEVEDSISEKMLKKLVNELKISKSEVYSIHGPLDLTFLMQVYSVNGHEDIRNEKYVPSPVKNLGADCNIFNEIKKKDIMLHHPYDSFEPVLEFIKQAAADPKVLAIKQTLYRVSGNSPIVSALAKAAENGKQVTVLVELKARFDEEHNIVWAKMLEKAGCHVIYGLVGLKTHCKITLVVRDEEDGIRRYVHLGTGNYNDSTAKLYTDIGLLTAAEEYGEDATAVFNMLSGYSEPAGWNRLVVAPLWLKKRILNLIEREKKNAGEAKPASIVAKMNSLCDPDVMEALYSASAAGVKVDLIVRGICCIRPGLSGVSENIQVRSIVGNFLEHSRIFRFENAGNPEYYCASADWMPRNLERRVEIMFPITDNELKEKINHVLTSALKDNVKAYVMNSDGTYSKANPHAKKKYCFQEAYASKKDKDLSEDETQNQARTFVPVYAHDIDAKN